MLTIAESITKWHELESRFLELQKRNPLSVRGVGLVTNVERYDDKLCAMRLPRTGQFASLSERAGTLLAKTPLPADLLEIPIEDSPRLVWMCLLATDESVDFRYFPSFDVLPNGQREEHAHGQWIIGDSIGVSLSMIDRILAALESMPAEPDAPVPQPATAVTAVAVTDQAPTSPNIDMSTEARALAVLIHHREVNSITAVAKLVGCDRGTLYKQPQFMAAWKAKQNNVVGTVRRGRIDDSGNIEADDMSRDDD